MKQADLYQIQCDQLNQAVQTCEYNHKPMHLSCLFWNAGRSTPDEEIAALAKSTKANLIALAEYNGNGVSLMHSLTRKGLSFFLVPMIGCTRIRILIAFQTNYIVHRREGDRYTIKEVALPGMLRILICVAHLPSKMHADDIDQLHTASFLKQDIELAEAEAGHSNTIAFGDFNMNPFDNGMMSAAALNSVPCLVTAKRKPRTIEGRKHSFFYNPSWNLLGDFLGPPGTYFHKSPSYLSHYWNTLDQVIIRPTLASRFERSELKVLTTTGEHPLISRTGRPNVSDHLPIAFSLKIN